MGFIGDLIRGKRGKKQAGEDKARFTEQQNTALGKEADFYKQEQAGKFDARVSQAQRDLATSGMKGYDDSGIKARQMSELAALSNDPRALMGGIAGTTQRAQDASTKQAQTEMNQRNRAAGDLQFEAVVGAGESALDIGQSMLTGGLAEKGMKVTPGEFSHKKNPIDIVREGAKIGEMTGGEYILNPEQAESIDEIQESISKKKKPSSKDLNKLYRAVRSVFSQRQFD